MSILQINIPTNNAELQEILVAQLSEIEFDSFEETPTELKAFITQEKYNESELEIILHQHQLSFNKSILENKNWNAVWESNFDSITVENFVGIRAHFHEPIQNVAHEIIITPKMSFGTGHHATTYLVMQLMEHINFKNKTVFDFGTGTGILAILAEKLGAVNIIGIDNDDWCVENAFENISTNNCKNISIKKADTASVERPFDIVIANINKNIITDNFLHLTNSVLLNGQIILSGLLVNDESDILHLSKQYNWHHTKTVEKNGWIAIQFSI